MAPSKRKQHNPIHGWLDKMFGGDWLEQDKVEDRKWATLKDGAESNGQEIIFQRGARHLRMKPTYDAQGMPVASGLRPQQTASAHSNIGSRMTSHHGQMSPHPPTTGSRQSYAAAMAQSQQLQNSYILSGLVPSHWHSFNGSNRLSHARNNPSMTPVSGPASGNQPPSLYPPNTPQTGVLASDSQYSNGSGSSEATQRNQGPLPRPQMHVTHSTPNVSRTASPIHSQYDSNRQQAPSNHHESPQTSHGGNIHQPSQSRYHSYTPSLRPSVRESQSAPGVSRSHRSEQQSRRTSQLKSQERSAISSESSTEPFAYSMSIATSKAQVGNMQRTSLEGMVPMTPSELRADDDDDDESSVVPSAWSMSIATSKAQVGNMQRTYLEGMVPKTPAELRAEFEENERREQELAKSNRRNGQNSDQDGRKQSCT